MRVSKFLTAGILALGALSTGAQAQESSATWTLNLPVLSYTSAANTEKPDGGDEAKSKSSGLATADLTQTWASVQIGKVLVYVNPFQDIKMVSVSYMVTDIVEVGLDLGLNSMKTDKPKDESSTNTFGFFVTATPDVAGHTLEASLIFDSTTAKSESVEEDSAGVETTTKGDTTTTDVKLMLNALVPVAKNLTYAGGISYLSHSENIKEGADKGKNTKGIFGINIASLRLVLN